jgi:hypothetical protein
MNYFNFPQQQQRQPQFDLQQFAMIAATLNQDSLNKLIQLARAQGISDKDIQQGINMLNSIR